MSAPAAHATEPAGLLSDNTLADLQLQRQPFAELSADDEPYADETTTEQLADIKQALITGDDLLLVLGEPGAGKSTLLTQLGTNSGLRIQCFSVRGSARFSTHNLFTGMLEAFKQAPPEDLKDMLDALVPCLQGMEANNILSAIVLDNADSVTDGELTRLLSSMLYLNSQDETLLRVALAAGDSFEDRIPELLPEGADLPYSSLSVEPFDDERAAAYLAFRLQRAGWHEALPFSEDELSDINGRAGGLPRSLHQEAAGVLEARSRGAGSVDALPFEPSDGATLESGPAERPAAKRSLAGGRGLKLALGALAIALIGGGLWLSRPGGPSPEEPSFTVVEQRPVETSAPGISLVEEGSVPEPAAPVETSAGSDPGVPDASIAVAEPDPEPDPEPELEPEPTPEPPVAAEPTTQAPLAAGDEPATDARTRRDDELLEPLAGTAETSGQEAARPPAPLPEPVDDTPAPLPAESPAAPDTPALESSTWILLQDPGQFTVQMSASTDRASVENFLQRADLASPNSIFAFDRDGATWYALVHGLYASIGEARAAVERMPAQAQSNQPWIRGVGRIQAVLKEQN